MHRRDNNSWTWRACWQELVTAGDLRPQLDRLRVQAGLPPVGVAPADRLPGSTRSVVAYRTIAAFLAHQVFSRARWQCLNGYLDSSGMGGGVRDQLFDKVGHAMEARPERIRDNLWRSVLGRRDLLTNRRKTVGETHVCPARAVFVSVRTVGLLDECDGAA